jgi:REP element-mobilizing transposase RayT
MLLYRRRLPHWQPDQVNIFLTWRLWGSLPLGTKTVALAPGQAFVANDRALDRDLRGPLWLKGPGIANLMAQAIQKGESERSFYHLHAWVVMPNHVHLLILPRKPLPVITCWLKGSTARQANQLLGRIGQPFWQDESFDRWVRNDREFERIARYIEDNPVSAGLATSAALWPWSSVGWQAKTPAPQ